MIDQKRAWLGSTNISLNNQNGTPWRDCSIALSGPAVSALSTSFNEIWYRHHPKIPHHYQKTVLLNNTVFRNKRKHAIIRQYIKRAKKRVWISNAYFAPLMTTTRMFQNAAKRGVDVRIVTGAYTDIPFYPLVSSTFYPELLDSGVNLFEYKKGVLHSKVMVIDDIMIIGSSNLNHRSILHDLELDIVIDDLKSIDKIIQRFTDNFQNSQKIEKHHIQEKGFLATTLAKLYRFFVYWI